MIMARRSLPKKQVVAQLPSELTDEQVKAAVYAMHDTVSSTPFDEYYKGYAELRLSEYGARFRAGYKRIVEMVLGHDEK